MHAQKVKIGLGLKGLDEVEASQLPHFVITSALIVIMIIVNIPYLYIIYIPDTGLSTSNILPHLNFKVLLRTKYYYYYHFTQVKILRHRDISNLLDHTSHKW